MCRYSGLFVVGVVVLVVAAVACSLGYIAPFWMARGEDAVGGFIKFFGGSVLTHYGLWGYCYSKGGKVEGCNWYFQQEFREEKDLADWEKAAQGLYGVGLLLLVVGLFIGLIHLLCCFCCKESSSLISTLGSLCISSGVLIGVGIGVFAGYASKENKYSGYSFYWAFFVAIGGAAAAIAASIIFFCASCRAKHYTGYHMTRVV